MHAKFVHTQAANIRNPISRSHTKTCMATAGPNLIWGCASPQQYINICPFPISPVSSQSGRLLFSRRGHFKGKACPDSAQCLNSWGVGYLALGGACPDSVECLLPPSHPPHSHGQGEQHEEGQPPPQGTPEHRATHEESK